LITKNYKFEDEEHRERLENLWRYILASLESESPKLSYVGVALNKDHSLSWIRHVKQLLLQCCLMMDSLEPKTHRDSVSLALILRTLISLTCPNSWAILKVKQLSAMKPALQQICNNILGFLIQKGFFLNLRVS
jgi:ubiquitin-protein ligase E3 B